VWHITHRCHKKEFLLKFTKDRQRWIAWLYEARKRFGLSVLNYTVTSNHVHLLVRDNGGHDVIPKSIQLIAGRTAQGFNLRKGRKGAFWEDRYHATAVETDEHLHQCLVYIDLNMVRAGVVKHPAEWTSCGFHEIQKPRDRYRIIDHEGLRNILGIPNAKELAETHRRWVEESLGAGDITRMPMWTESVAVGNRRFVEQTRERLGIRAIGRKVSETVILFSSGKSGLFTMPKTRLKMPF
jgi:REP element-mobilizing transposase RayT